jgi:hypothetical protein
MRCVDWFTFYIVYNIICRTCRYESYESGLHASARIKKEFLFLFLPRKEKVVAWRYLWWKIFSLMAVGWGPPPEEIVALVKKYLPMDYSSMHGIQ